MGGESSRRERGCYNCSNKNHFISECLNPKKNKAFVKGAWSYSEDGNKPQNEATCLMAIETQEVHPKPSISNNNLEFIEMKKENEKLLRFNNDFAKTFAKLLKEKCFLENEQLELLNKINDLEFEVKKLTNNKEVVEPCQICDVLTQEVNSLKSNVSKLQDEALNFSKFKKSSIIFNDALSHQKFS
ncbi:hypothetical protein Tco_0520437 [Tanacetum coccineum]